VAGKSEFEKKALQLGTIFKPAAPIDQVDLFCGRQTQIRSVVDAINQTGQHVILYGERGVGKTSLSNMLFPSLHAGKRQIVAPHINCDNGDDFTSLWRKVFAEITTVSEKRNIGFIQRGHAVATSIAEQINGPLTPDVVRRILTQVGEHVLVIVILDEFDKIPSLPVRSLIADTVKVLSDRQSPVTMVIVGVADDVNELIDQHHSIERCLVQVPMPRMSRDELEQIVTNGLEKTGMSIDDEALHEISGLSKGLPHYTHLISLHCARQALDAGSLSVSAANVKGAVAVAIAAAQQTTKSAYNEATLSIKKNALYRHVLLACAMSDTDDFGYFAPVDIRDPLSRVMKKPYSIEAFAKHLHAFCDPKRGPVLKRMENRSRFRFVNPLMQPFILMKGLADGLVTEEELGLKRDPKAEGKLF
jgi:Cdc6-like AAA superfamily ATPase